MMARIQIRKSMFPAHLLVIAASIGATCCAKGGDGSSAAQGAAAGADLHRLYFDPVPQTPADRQSSPASPNSHAPREPLALGDVTSEQSMPT
jgi:hypothetical protein